MRIKSCLTPIMHIFTYTSWYNYKYSIIYAPSLHFHKKIFVMSLIKAYPGCITFSATIFGWSPTSNVSPGGWFTGPSDIWRNWKPKRPNIKAPFRAVIFPICTATILMDQG